MDQLEVGFCAGGAGIFPMTWGQQDFWRKVIRRYGDESWYYNIAMVVDLPGDAGLAGQPASIAALRRMVERNQVLRTHFLDGPDGPRQRIEGSGSFTVGLRHSTPEASRADADALAAELAAAAFDHQAEWGIRLALVCVDQSARHLVFAVSHLVADGAGVRALIADFFDLLRVQDRDGELKGRWQPADQVERECSGRGKQRSQRAIRYWRKQLERMPPSMFALPAMSPEQARFAELRFESRALAVAAARLADSCQVSVPSVVLAVAALGLCAMTGQPVCVLMPVSGNRLDPELRAMVGLAAQHALLVADLSAIGTVEEAVRAVHRAATAAYSYGYYDPVAIQDLIDELEAQRGVRFDLDLLYNDLSEFLDDPEDPGSRDRTARLGEADARKLPAESVLVRQEGTWQGQTQKMYLAAQPHRTFCRLRLTADTAYLPEQTMRALLRGIEQIALEAAYRDVQISALPALTGLRPTTRTR